MVEKKISSLICFLFLIAIMPINVIAADLEETTITHEKIMDNMGIFDKLKYNWVKMFGGGSRIFSLLGEELNCDTQPFAVLTYTVDNTLQQTVDCGGKSLIDLYNKDGYKFIKEVWSPQTFIHNLEGSQYIVECYRCPTDPLTPEPEDGATIPGEDIVIPGDEIEKTEERGIYIVKLETDYDAKEDLEVTYHVTFINDLDVVQTINAEVGIFADDIVKSWGMLSIGSFADPIQSCEDEDFISSKRIIMDGNTKVTYTFSIKVPNIESTLADGTSNWDSSHTVVAGLYDECGGGYHTSNGKFGTSNGAWKIKNLEVEGGYNPQTIFFCFVGFLLILMIISLFIGKKGKKK